jgi:MFS family permease
MKLRGIFYGWWILAASFVLYFLSGGTVSYGFAAFFTPINTEMGWSRGETSFGFSLRSVEGGVVQPLVGFVIERFGLRKCIVSGIVVTGIAFFLMSWTSSLLTFYVSVFALAMGSTLGMGIAEQVAIANWFRRRRSFCMGILTTGTGLSGVMTPVMVYLIHAYGWRQSLVILSPLVLVVGLPLSLMIRPRPEPYGYLPDGDKAEDPVGSPASTTAIQSHSIVSTGDGLTVRECLRTRTFWLLTISYAFTAFAAQTIQVHAIPFLTDIGVSEDTAALTITGITIISLVGRLGFSWLGDIYDKKRIIIISFAMETAGAFLFANIRSPWMIIPFLLLYSPGFGAPIPLIPAMQADCFGTKSFASIRGLMNLGYAVPAVVGPFLAGWLYDILGSYYLAFTLFAILCGLAIPVVMLAKTTPARTAVPREAGTGHRLE